MDWLEASLHRQSDSWRNIAITLIDPIPPSLQPETVTADGTDTQQFGMHSWRID